MSWRRIDGIARYIATDSTLYVWCSGSDGWGDFWRNIDPRAEQVFPRGWVASADIREARTVWRSVHRLARERHVHIIGFSRGAAVAVALGLWLPPDITYSLELYAPKRAANRRAVSELHHVEAYAQKGDVIPYLPPWFDSVHVDWRGPWKRPWEAHRQMAKRASRRRHELGKKGRET